MRQHPVGTGPFKFVEFKPNESIRLACNPDYWKPGRPYLDGIEYTIIPNRSTAILAFTAGEFDLTFPYEVTVPLMKDVKSQAPQAVCELVPSNANANLLLVNRRAPPSTNQIGAARWHWRSTRSGLNNTGSGVDDPTSSSSRSCGSECNYTGYCDAEFKSVAPPLLEAALRCGYGFRLDQ